MATPRNLNFVENEGISVATTVNPATPDVLDIEIGNTIGGLLDAKGDLVAGSDLDLAARLEVGSNGQVLTADSTTDTGLVWATPAGGDPLAATQAWMPLADSDGLLVLDSTGDLIPTLIAL